MLLTATSGRPTREIACRLGERNPAVLESGGAENDDAWYPVRITPALLERLTGAELALPELTARRSISPSPSVPPRCSVHSATDRLGGALRPRAERHRRSRASSARRPRAAGHRGQAPRTVLRRHRGRALEYRAEGRGAPARDETSPLAARLPRRRERDEPDDAHRGGAAAGTRHDAHRVLSAFAAFTLRPALPLRPVQQLRRQLPGAAARHDARHDGDRGAAADPDARRGAGCDGDRAASARRWSADRRTLRSGTTAFARLNALVAGSTS